jgi:hypothetical protein
MSDIAAPHDMTSGYGESVRLGAVRKVLLVATVLSVTFPYIQLVPLGSYTQPYPLLLSVAVLALSPLSGLRQMRWTDAAALAGFALVGIVLFLLTCFPYRNVQEYKYLLTYVSPLIIAGACVTLLDWDRRLVGWLVAGSILVWFWIAMAQALISPTFMTALLGEWGRAAGDIAASGRGVIALAPEPTHHAFHMLLLGGCVALLGRHRWVLLLCIVDIVLLARSANGMLVLGLAFAVALVVYRPRLGLLLFVLGLGVVALHLGDLVLSISKGNRVLTLLGIVLNNPLGILLEDYSTNLRIGGALVGFLETATQLFIPHGLSFEFWSSQRDVMRENFPFLIDISTVGIPSGYGVVLFQAGILVVPFIIASTRRMILAVDYPMARIAVFCIPLVFLFQYYLSAPQFALAYAIAIYSWQNRQLA